MGDRGHVHIKDEGVWLYTHWTAHNLVDTVKKALSKQQLKRLFEAEPNSTEQQKAKKNNQGDATWEKPGIKYERNSIKRANCSQRGI